MSQRVSPSGAPTEDEGRILDSWKEIASYLGRAVRTVQVWEREEGLPVHRHQHRKGGTVYAYPAEIEAWREQRDEFANNRTRVRGRVVAAVALVLLVAAATVWTLLDREAAPGRESSSAVAARPPEWLMITGFVNSTGNEMLDGTLEAALRRELANSKLLKLAPSERIDDVLLLMGRSRDREIDAETAHEVAVRDGGIRAILTGRIEQLGPTYLLSVDLLNGADGVRLAGLSAAADSIDEVLPAVRDLSRQVRETLGESLAELEAAEGLSRVSTPSLRALELYSRANELLLQEIVGGPDRNSTAAELLREAIAEDPRFASSYTHLAWALRRQTRPVSEVMHEATMAVKLSDEATPVERYFIRGSFHHLSSFASGQRSDVEAAVAAYRALLELDPAHFWASWNAAATLRTLGRGSEVLELLLGLVEARPNDVRTLTAAARELVVTTGDLERARSHVDRVRRLQGEQPPGARVFEPFVESFPIHEAWVRGDIDAASRLTEELAAALAERPAGERRPLTSAVQLHYLDLGMLAKADALQKLYSTPDPAFWSVRVAWRREDAETLRRWMMERYEEGNLFQAPRAAVILAQFGQFAEAERFLAELPSDFELEPGLVLATRGMVDLAAGRLDDAVVHLQSALPHLRYEGHLGTYFYAVRMLSRAWEALGRPERGLDALEDASQLKAAAYQIGHWWLEVELRRAELLRAMGRDESARAIEDEVRHHTAWADPDSVLLAKLARRVRFTGPLDSTAQP